MSPLPADFEERLRAHLAPEPAEPPARRSAVAMVLRLEPAEHAVLLMTRAERADDPWSGQVSLPGGRHEPEDPHLLATAIRETREEVGIELGAAPVLGRLAPMLARARARIAPMDVTPWVFRLDDDQRPTPGPEASEAFWLPLAPVVAGELDDEHVLEREGALVRHPCWRFERRPVWGMTYFLLRGLLAIAGAPPGER